MIGPIKNDAINTAVIDKIDDKDTIFVEIKTNRKMNNSIKKQYGEKASNTPDVQATPFPPLKLA